MVTNQSVSNRVDPDSVGALVDWLQDRHDFPRDPTLSVHDIWAHLLFGFAPTYKGEIYGAVPEMVLRHIILDDDAELIFLERRPSLQEVEESLARIHNGFAKDVLKHRYDPWNFELQSQTPCDDYVSKKILLPLTEQTSNNPTDDNGGV